MVQCHSICSFNFLLTLSVRQQNADQAISRSICSLLAALRATLLTCFGSLIICFTDFECCSFFFAAPRGGTYEGSRGFDTADDAIGLAKSSTFPLQKSIHRGYPYAKVILLGISEVNA